MLRHLCEHLEDFLEPVHGNPETAVAHADERVLSCTMRANFDRAALRRVLGRVAEQVADDLREALEVAADVYGFWWVCDRQPVPALGDERSDQLDGRVDHLLDVDRVALQLDLSVRDARQIE